MSIWKTVRACIVVKYASGKGRANREEFITYLLCFILFCLFWCIFIILQIDWSGGLNLLDFVLMYIPFLFVPPLIAVTIRRFHDIGKSGWLAVLLLIPFINILALGLLLRHGDPEPNRYGPVPDPVHV